MSNSKWSWSFGRGISWALPVGLGGLLGVRNLLAHSIASSGDYSPLIVVLCFFGLSFWLGGYRRKNKQTSQQEDDIRERVARMQKNKNEQT